LLSHLESARLEWLAVLAPPFPTAIKLTGYILANGLGLAVPVVKLPFAVAFAVLEAAFTRKPPSAKSSL